MKQKHWSKAKVGCLRGHTQPVITEDMNTCHDWPEAPPGRQWTNIHRHQNHGYEETKVLVKKRTASGYSSAGASCPVLMTRWVCPRRHPTERQWTKIHRHPNHGYEETKVLVKKERERAASGYSSAGASCPVLMTGWVCPRRHPTGRQWTSIHRHPKSRIWRNKSTGQKKGRFGLFIGRCIMSCVNDWLSMPP